MMPFIHKYDAMLQGSQNDKEMGECANVQMCKLKCIDF